MYTNPIEILCNGDFPGRNVAREYITLEDLILLNTRYQEDELKRLQADRSEHRS